MDGSGLVIDPPAVADFLERLGRDAVEVRGLPGAVTFYGPPMACVEFVDKHDGPALSWYYVANPGAPSGAAVSDADITAAAILLVDIDARRQKAAASMATEAERGKARDVAARVLGFLAHYVPGKTPAIVESGNGVQLLLVLTVPADVGLFTEWGRFLDVLDMKFSDDAVHIDTSIRNPSRVMALPGSIKRKGTATDERPYRPVVLRRWPKPEERYDPEALRAFLAVWNTLAAKPPLLRAVEAVRVVPGDGRFYNAKLSLSGWARKYLRCGEDGLRDVLALYSFLRGAQWEREWNEHQQEEENEHIVKTTMGKDADDDEALGTGFFTGDERKALLRLAKEAKPPSPGPAGRGRAADGRHEHARFVDEVMKGFTFVTMDDSLEIYVYDQGAYAKGGEGIIRAWVESKVFEEGDSAKRDLVAEVVAAVQRRTPVKRAEFNPPGLLPLQNGVLDLKTLAVRPHARTPRFTFRLPVGYDPKAKCPTWEKVVAEVLPDAEKRLELQKVFGYCLAPGNPYQKAFLEWGSGANGKGVVNRVLEELLGPENVSHVSLQQLGNDRFAAAEVYGHLLNVCPDVPIKAIGDTSLIKQLVGEDIIQAQRKYGQPFDFRNGAKLVVVANRLPQVLDNTVAWWRRWEPIEFPVSFVGVEDETVVDRVRPELPGVLLWAIEGLRRLRAEKFARSGWVDEAMATWKRLSDPVFWFSDECLEEDRSSWVPSQEVYAMYVEFCDERGLAKEPEQKLYAALLRHFPWLAKARRLVGGQQARGYNGIVLTRHPEGSADSVTAAPKQAELALDGPGQLPGLPDLPESLPPHTTRAHVKEGLENPGNLGNPGNSPSPLPRLVIEAMRKLRGDRMLQEMEEGFSIEWQEEDIMRGHGFEQAMRPTVRASVVEARRRVKAGEGEPDGAEAGP